MVKFAKLFSLQQDSVYPVYLRVLLADLRLLVYVYRDEMSSQSLSDSHAVLGKRVESVWQVIGR